jgi:hypothetical protein
MNDYITIMLPKLEEEVEKCIQDALEFNAQNPDELVATVSRIFKVNVLTLRSRIRRRQTEGKQHGGHNKVLSDAQNEGIRRYIRRSCEAGYGATRAVVFEAIVELKGAEIPPKPAPSKSWFSNWIKTQTQHFHAIKTRPIDRVRVSAHNIDEMRSWFQEYKDYCEQIGVKKGDIFNFDEVGFRVGVAPGQEVLVPSHIREVCLCLYSLCLYITLSIVSLANYSRCTLKHLKPDSL